MPTVQTEGTIENEGYLIVRNFLTPEEITKYLAASEEVVEYAREGKWSQVRTRGKQFPPWPANFSPDIWGVSGLLHPDLKELSYPFHELYSSDKILKLASGILHTAPDKLLMELLNMLINPLTDFGLDWHRDNIKPEVTPEEEADQLLGANALAGTQFNLALTEDSCLIVVPGSHNRVRTQEEREKLLTKKISGQLVVPLHPGDIVFYNNNILHRGEYDSSKKRITLHGSYGHEKHGKLRAKGILQYGVTDWLSQLKPKTANLEMLKEKLVKLGKEFEGVKLEYAQDK